MSIPERWQIELEGNGGEVLRRAGVDLTRIFADERIVVWRDLPERQNCTLDLPPAPGQPARLHIKRYKSPNGQQAQAEAGAIRLLQGAGIATVPLLAWGQSTSGQAFLITADLTGYLPADRVVTDPAELKRYLPKLAALAAQLHRSGLHHQDLYLCHFFVRPGDASAPIRLIDPGRVSRLRSAPWHVRWVVKDLAQFCYSMAEIGLPREELRAFLDAYFAHAVPRPKWLIRKLVPWKTLAIARHDLRLRRKRPGRRVALEPASPPHLP